MTTQTFKIEAVSQLETVVEAVQTVLKNQADDQVVVVALHGDLGAGKTTFMQHLAKSYGVTEVVTSPTFVVMKQYALTEEAFDLLVHIDAYRLEDRQELEVLGFKELLTLPRTLICVEWAEKVADLLPNNTLHLSFAISGDDRDITFTYGQEK